MKKLSVVCVVAMIVLAGCGGIISNDESQPSQQPPSVNGADETEPTNESNDSSLPEPGVDTSGDGITDRTAVQLGLDPDTEYHESFVGAIQIAQSEDPNNASILASSFADNGTVNESYYTTLENYTILAENHSSAVSKLNTELISERSPEFIDKQLRVLLTVSPEVRTTILGSYNLGDSDWSTSGLKNWEEIEYGTDILATDTSSDGIPDGPSVHDEETYPNADPLEKDVYLEVVTADGVSIESDTLSQVQEAYAEAPVENPDGTEGIDLHIVQTESRQYEPNLYHYAKIVPQDSIPSDRGGDFSGQRDIRVGHFSSDITASILMHELGHSLGLLPDELQGIDSRSLSFEEYRSSMNYNSPNTFVGYSDGSDSMAGTNDWAHIECRMASQARQKVIPYHENFNISSDVFQSAGNETTRSDECVVGIDITSVKYEGIFIETDQESDNIDTRTEIENIAAEQDLSYTIFNESAVPDTFEIKVNLTNTADRRQTDTVRLDTYFESRNKDAVEVSLEPGEQTTITLQFESDIVDQLEPTSSAIYEVKTTEDTVDISIELIKND